MKLSVTKILAGDSLLSKLITLSISMRFQMFSLSTRQERKSASA